MAGRARLDGSTRTAPWRWLAGLLLALACCCALAAPARSLRFERIGVEQGLSQESVFTILQDRNGFMWFGTQAGLSRFDGYRMTVYRNDPDDAATLPDNFVLSSYEDTQGQLWFGTKGGLARFEPASGKFVRFRLDGAGAAAHAHRAITAIAPDGAGGLWLGTPAGLLRFDPARGVVGAWRHDARQPDSLADDQVNTLAVDQAGNLWIGTPSGLDRLAGAGRFEHRLPAPDGDARGNNVLSLSPGPGQTLWIGTAIDVVAWQVGRSDAAPQHFGQAQGISQGRVVALYHDALGGLWVGTERDGLKWRDPGGQRFVSYRHQALDLHSLSDNQVGAVCVDRSGTLWVGTLFGGLSRVDLASGGFTRYTHVPGQAGGIGHNKVRAILGDADGALWLGSNGGGLTRFEPDTGRTVAQHHQAGQAGTLPDDQVTALAQAQGRLWVGTSAGLAWRDRASGRFTPVPLGEDGPGNHVQTLYADRADTLWVMTRGGLFALGRDGSRRAFRHDPRNGASLGENLGYAVLEDRHGTLWIGTENGLEQFDRARGVFVHYRHQPGVPGSLRHSRVYALYESAAGELWIGTAGGLHRLERGADGKPRFAYLPTSDDHAALPIGAIREDAAGVLWISSTIGMIRLDPRNGRFKHYTAEDGMIDGSYFVGASWAGPDGTLYFGGVNGVTAFQPDAIRDNPYPPTVVVTDFQVLNRPRALGVPVYAAREVTVPWRDGVFSIEFAALHYADPRANRYAYRLEGFDRAWIDADASKRFATYTNLDPGRYTFRLRAANKDGVWGSATPLVITVTPPFWKTWWFRAAAAALAVALVYLGYRLRVRVLVQQKDVLECQVAARTAELRLQKETAERGKREVEHQKEVVEQAHRSISRLSDIGRTLTANLDSEAVMLTLYEHVADLMDAQVFGVGIRDSARGTLTYPFATFEGRRMPPLERALDEPQQLAACCVNGNAELLVGDLERDYVRWLPQAWPPAVARLVLPFETGPGPVPRALLMVPITVGARVLGMVTVQSTRAQAFQRVHLDMLRTLAAYAGIALDNAQAYRQLKDAQAQLVSQEKMASLGSLVAGVAHELNTPIGNSLLMASSLQEMTRTLSDRYREAALRRSDLEQWIGASNEASDLIVRSLHGAADLVSSFRQVAVDQASAQRRRFDLAQACHEIAATMMKQVRVAGHTLVLEVPGGIELDSYPGPLGQVLINFINNALLHAFDAPGGTMTLSATVAMLGRVRLLFRDDGHGIDASLLGRVFEPFFTTRMGSGGTGLGLNIAYNIVTGLLGGVITVDSAPGEGTAFVLDLPLCAPVVAGDGAARLPA